MRRNSLNKQEYEARGRVLRDLFVDSIGLVISNIYRIKKGEDSDMECKVTCFERAMYLVKPLPEGKLREAVEIIQEDSFQDFLDFCIENGCFMKPQAATLYEGIITREDLDGNYWEKNPKKLATLYEAVGVTKEALDTYEE